MRRIPVDTLNAASQTMLDRGERILQGVRFAPTDEGHVAKLLEFMDPPHGARIADMGCGFGEVARLMRKARPDLSFVMVNDNAFQLSHAPDEPGLKPVRADMIQSGLRDNSFDVVMFLYSLCLVDHYLAIEEARRIVRTGGVLFVFDYLREWGDDALAYQHLWAKFRRFDDMLKAMIGWSDISVHLPDGTNDRLFRFVFPDPKLYRRIFDDLRPMLWRAVAK